MVRLWSPQSRYSTWRRIWVALAEAEHELGLPITAAQVRALQRAVDDIDFRAAAAYERKLRHDVMAHIHAFGDAAPAARGIIHLGATSMDIVDNADLMLMRQGLELLCGRLVRRHPGAGARSARNTPACRRSASRTSSRRSSPRSASGAACGWPDLVSDLQRLERAAARAASAAACAARPARRPRS